MCDTGWMTDHNDEPVRDSGYWSDLIDSFEEQEAPPDAASLAADDVSRMLGGLRRLMARAADYQLLHDRELARLEARRAELVGPVIARIERLEQTLKEYGLRAYLDFGKTGTILVTPNGSIKASRPLVPGLQVDDAKVAEWLSPLASAAVTYHPKVSKSAARTHLEQGEQDGSYRRAIVIEQDGRFIVIALIGDRPWLGEMEPGWRGVWIRPSVAGDAPDTLEAGLARRRRVRPGRRCRGRCVVDARRRLRVGS